MSTGYTALTTAYTNAFVTNLFDSDLIFQKLVIFLVDFIHIVYDRISDSPNASTVYDINDELAIFAFSVLIHSLSVGLENSQKVRFTSLFRNNLALIRLQFRRLFVFMSHPNHKLPTRLQLVKRLMNTPNCETILKCIVTLSDSSSIPFSTKLSIHLNSLINASTTTSMSNNDKEILSHLSQILTQCGLNYKNDFTSSSPPSTLFVDSSADFVVTSLAGETPYLIVSQTNRKNSIDLNTQIDRDLDEEILKIFHKAKTAFMRFLDQYEKLVVELSEYGCVLTNQVVLQHSSVRKLYLQV